MPILFNEKYHNNCHDYLKPFYLEKYAVTKYKPFLYQIQQQIPRLDICNETAEDLYTDIIVCDQHAVVFGHYLDIYPVLATYALNACVGLIMFAPEYRVAALAHIDGLPGYSKQSAVEDGLDINFDPVNRNIRMMLEHIRQLAGTTSIIGIDYYLVGGIFGLSEVMVHDIVQCINRIPKNQFQFHFRGRNLLGPENQSRNICIDTRTGQITYFDYLANAEVYDKVRNQQKLPANIVRAPRISEAYLDVTYMPVWINN